jgi:hypothetical protein
MNHCQQHETIELSSANVVEANSIEVQGSVVNCLCSCCRMLSPILQCGSYRMIENSWISEKMLQPIAELAGRALPTALIIANEVQAAALPRAGKLGQ